MSDRQFERAVHDWLEDGSDRTPPSAIEAVLFAVKTTPQQRDLRIPRRFTHMPSYVRYAAAAAIVAVVGVGVLAFNSRSSGVGNGTPAPTQTAAPTATAAPTPAASGIAAWTDYTSEVYGFTLGYPEDWTLHAAATRKWQAGDILDADGPYADAFVSPEEATVGLFVWNMPVGEGGENLESIEGLKAWAEAFCDDVVVSACEDFTQRAEPMCLVPRDCRSAILVPTAGQQYAFFMDWGSFMFTDIPDQVRVVVVARADGFPSAARYGGSVELLRSILTTMDVWAPGKAPAPED